MKQLIPWLLWFAVGCSADLPGEDIEHHPADGGLADADLRPVQHAPMYAPPVAGGGLEIDGLASRAVLSDPDRGRVVIADVDARRLVAAHPLASPGRVALAPGRAYVASPGAVAVFELVTGRPLDPIDVCATPRGLAVDGPWLYVACLGGALLKVDRQAGLIVETTWLPPDLRDVLVVDGRVWVSRLRDAEIIVLDGLGRHRIARPRRVVDGIEWQGRVGWRMRRLPDGRVALLHQWHRDGRAPDRYGRSLTICDEGLVVPAVSILEPDVTERIGPDGLADPAAAMRSHAIGGVVLAVDAAGVGDWLALATPGQADAHDPFTPPADGLPEHPLRWLSMAEIDRSVDDCLRPRVGGQGERRPVAVAVHGEDFVFYDRESGLLRVTPAAAPGLAPPPPAPIDLGGGTVLDSGHDLFHVDPGGGVACANCHPEGADDGHTWDLGVIGPRRTQPLYGGIADTAPYHWDGSLADFDALLASVRRGRMGGGPLSPPRARRFVEWLHAIPLPEFDTPDSPLAIAAGGDVFAQLGCHACHFGDRLSDGEAHDVGTGGTYETPTLRGAWLRGRLMHDGCAADIEARLGACGGDLRHGPFVPGADHPLTPRQIRDLIAFLSSL